MGDYEQGRIEIRGGVIDGCQIPPLGRAYTVRGRCGPSWRMARSHASRWWTDWLIIRVHGGVFQTVLQRPTQGMPDGGWNTEKNVD